MSADTQTPRAYRVLAEERVSRRRIAVVGGGLMGTATAYAAARLGGPHVTVDLYEANQIGHEAGASIDSTRLFRHAYGEWSHYTRWAAETFPLWQDLERASGRTLYEPTPSVWAAHAENQVEVPSALTRVFASEDPRAFIEGSQTAFTALELPYEILDGREYQRRFPQFANTGVVGAFVDTNSGLLFAGEAVLAFRDVARHVGVTVHERTRALEVVPDSSGCGVRFADGTAIDADVVVLAINGWTRDILPTVPLLVTEQLTHYLVPDASVAAEFEPGAMPFCFWASNGMWVFPSRNGAVKIGDNYPSRTLQRPTERRMPEPAYRERVLRLATEQMPALRDATLVQERACFYDYSPDGDFIIDQWDPHARLILACGFSGHGFKFGPLIGQRLAHFALTGERPPDLTPFALSRFEPRAGAAAGPSRE